MQRCARGRAGREGAHPVGSIVSRTSDALARMRPASVPRIFVCSRRSGATARVCTAAAGTTEAGFVFVGRGWQGHSAGAGQHGHDSSQHPRAPGSANAGAATTGAHTRASITARMPSSRDIWNDR